jgi:diguanylate cyclase (GGDEF)-like protein
MNKNGTVLGAISLYRKASEKFQEEEFRRLEIVASQTALAIMKVTQEPSESPPLFDNLTTVPNGFQLYLMFDQVAMDAHRYEYPLALLTINLDELKQVRRRWGHISGDECLRAAAAYLLRELRETDVLVRYAADEFIALNPKMTRNQAESLKSRLQNDLDHFNFTVRPDASIPIPVSIGISVYPEDGAELESLISTAEWRMREDRKLRAAIGRRISNFPF